MTPIVPPRSFRRITPPGIVAWIGALVALVGLSGCINIPLNAKKPMQYYELAGEGAPVVYLLRIDGLITAETSVRGVITGESIPGTVEQVRFQLDRIEDDGLNPRGLIVRINSPGGTVTASDIIYHELMLFKRKHRIPIVVLMMDVATSGGYYISMAGDSLVAHPTTTTGSLGVIVPGINIAGLMEKYGIQDASVTSGPMKDLLSMTRPVKGEDVQVVQSVVDDLYRQFLAVVKKGRGDRLTQPLPGLADGRIYTANQAKAAGLVDRIGYFEDAVDEMKKLSGVSRFRVVTLATEPEQGQANIYMSQRNQPRAEPGSLQSLVGLEQPPMAPFYYLWMP